MSKILCGDAAEVLKTLPQGSVNMCVTSPPYYGLRDYGIEGQIGIEQTPQEYIDRLVEVFAEVYRVLKPDGTLWLNISDSYAGSGKGPMSIQVAGNGKNKNLYDMKSCIYEVPKRWENIKPKDMIGIPWLLAFALRDFGYYLRSDIIWHKTNCLPESVKDRPSKSYEHIFLFAKSPKYYFDYKAIQEPTFKALTADSFRTYYPEGEEPVIDEENIFAAKYSGDILKEQLDLENAGFELPNGDFETGDLSGWWGDSLFAVSNAEDYFGDIFPDNIPTYNKEGDWFVSSESDMNATGTLSSKAFVVTDTNSRWITFRLGGNKTENLYVSLMQYVEGGDDIEIAKFNNNLFSDPYRSFGMTKYAWQIPEEYVGQKLYFVLHDEATSDTPFGVLTADEFKTDYAIGQEPVIDGKTIFPASYCEAVIVGLDEKLGLDTATEELRNGDFETGDMTGWFTLDLEKNYIVTKEGTFFEEYYPINVPQYAVDGNYFLTGCKFNENETGLEAVGSIYSQAFVVGGTGWITFKMGGSNNESLKLQLIRYVEDGEHEVIAEFNNYLFSDPYRSMGMTNYAYKIDEKYQGEKCYFKLVDEANTSVSFGAISLDSVKTYYTQEIQLYKGLPVDISNEVDSPKLSDDKNFYPAAYVRLAVEGITEKLGLDTATEQIRNGGFETGDYTGWFTEIGRAHV